ncbi:MAG: hypothetical protein WD875_10975 [Pirellulales bacterium]
MPGNSFDPLAEWLGIPPAEQPPHHYRLLGLKLFEDRAEKIEQAADERMAAVRKHQNGPRAAATQQVLNRLAAAKQCLLNPATRDAYDAAIHGQLAASKSAASAGKRPRAVEQPPTFDFETPPADEVLDFGSDTTSGRADGSVTRENATKGVSARRRGGRPLMLPSIALTIFTACAGAWVLFGRDNDGEQQEESPVVIVKRSPSDRPAASPDAPPVVRPVGGVLRCMAENVSREDAHRRGGDLLDMTLVEGRVEVSWTVRVRKAGFYTASITYSAAGEAGQTFEIEMDDGALRTTPIRPTAGQFATDELKTVVFRKTGDHRVVLRAAGKVDRTRTIKVREMQFRPVSLPSPAK